MILPHSSTTKSKPVLDKLRNEISTWLKDILKDYEPTKIRSDKIIRDAVCGFISLRKYEVNLVDSPIIQRLRYIHQNSLAYLTYPSATHTRFEHSLGVMAIGDSILQTIMRKHKDSEIKPLDIVEVRIAALLHDCGHGPFSHASETVYYDMATELQSAKIEDPDILGDAAGHEILSYLIVTSKEFKGLLWDKICKLYKSEGNVYKILKMVSFDRIGRMIVGVANNKSTKYLTQIINGPFDSDKFDYIVRDGYFSGLITQLDIERMAISIDIETEPKDKETILCMDIGGATILEQLLFNKMLLFSSMYHHHKVRAAFQQLIVLLTTARTKKIKIRDVSLDSPVNFLRLDDDKLICDLINKTKLKHLSEGIRSRKLLKRALVIDNEALRGPSAKSDWVTLQGDLSQIMKYESEIAETAGLEREYVRIDFPPSPRIYKTAKFSMIRRASNRPLVSLDSLYPVSGWLAGYEQFRYRSYIFCPDGAQQAVAKATKKVLENIDIDYDLASSLAKWTSK